MYAYFIDISQGSVETHFWCGGIYSYHIIANCLQSVPVKEFWKSINNWWRYRQKQSGTFLAHPVHRHHNHQHHHCYHLHIIGIAVTGKGKDSA